MVTHLTGRNPIHWVRGKLNTHILYSVCIFLLIEVVIKGSHVGLFEVGLGEITRKTKYINMLWMNRTLYQRQMISLERRKSIELQHSQI